MRIKFLSVGLILILSILTLSACNLPERQAVSSPTSTVTIPQSSPTPAPLCANTYFPNAVGDRWEYSGANSILGDYTRTDTITDSTASSFTQQTTLANITYSVPYNCTVDGLVSANPVQQYAGALLSSPDLPVSVQLTSNAGITLPAKITPGDSWQQTADFQAKSQQINLNGRFVFNYKAMAYENITVAAGTFNALRVEGTIQIEVTGLHISAGSYTTTTWWAPGIGIVKSEGASQVTGIEFTDSMQLTSFTPGQ